MPATTPVYSGFGSVQLGQNHVVAGAARAAQHSENFHIHRLGNSAREDCPGSASESAMNLAKREESAAGGRASGRSDFLRHGLRGQLRGNDEH